MYFNREGRVWMYDFTVVILGFGFFAGSWARPLTLVDFPSLPFTGRFLQVQDFPSHRPEDNQMTSGVYINPHFQLKIKILFCQTAGK